MNEDSIGLSFEMNEEDRSLILEWLRTRGKEKITAAGVLDAMIFTYRLGHIRGLEDWSEQDVEIDR